MAPFDAVGFQTETKPQHDLTTPRGRLLYLRDVVVPKIDRETLDMAMWDCGTTACLAGHAARDANLRARGLETNGSRQRQEFFGLTNNQHEWLFMPDKYDYTHSEWLKPTHAELRAHIDDVLEGRVQ